MKIVVFTFLLFFGMVMLHAQDSIPPIIKQEQSIEWISEGYVASNAITNKFIKTFYLGSFIDDPRKKDVSGKLSSVNRLGAASKWGISYSYHSEMNARKPYTVFSFSFFDRVNADVKFHKDFFNTIFYGNKMFAGTTAEMGDFKFNFLRYQQFRFGWERKNAVTRSSYGVAFSLLSGDRNTYINGLFANLYTAQDGTYIDLYLKGSVTQTDTAHKGFFAQNGMGMSTDFFYEHPYLSWKCPGSITIEVRDFGFITWKNNSIIRSVDSSFHYDGISVADLFKLDSNKFVFHVNDQIKKHSVSDTKRYTTNIPVTLAIHTKVIYRKNIAFEKGISWMLNTPAKPYLYAKVHFLFGRINKFDVGCQVGYGGYGKLNAGLDVNMEMAKKYSIRIMDSYLFTGIAGISNPGMGLGLQVIKKF